MLKKLLYKFKKLATITPPQQTEEKSITAYLMDSMNKLNDNANNNEKKLDDFFLRQATIPNLFFTTAVLSSNFVAQLNAHVYFKISYFLTMFTFFATYFLTILITIIDKRKSSNKHIKSQKLYAKHRDKSNSDITPEIYSQVVEQITENNPSYNGCFYNFLRWCEDIFRVINVLSIIVFLIMGTIYYV